MAGPPFGIDETSPADNAVISAFPANERLNRFNIEDWLNYISDPATGLIRESVLPAPTSEFPSGTKVLFQQTAAPTGWTKDVTHNNKALRLVNGTVTTGGTTAFTTVFASRTPTGSNTATTATGSISSDSATGSIGNTTATGSIGTTAVSIDNTTATGTVGGTALTVANLPVHDHSFSATTSSDGDHTHATKTGAPNGGANLAESTGNNNYASEGHIQNAGAHTHTVSGTTGATGSGTTHTHSFTGTAHNHTSPAHGHSFTGTAHNHTFTPTAHSHTFTGTSHNHTWTGVAMDFAVQYVDVIICTKD